MHGYIDIILMSATGKEKTTKKMPCFLRPNPSVSFYFQSMPPLAIAFVFHLLFFFFYNYTQWPFVIIELVITSHAWLTNNNFLVMIHLHLITWAMDPRLPIDLWMVGHGHQINCWGSYYSLIWCGLLFPGLIELCVMYGSCLTTFFLN